MGKRVQIIYRDWRKMAKNATNETDTLQNCKVIVKRSLSLEDNSHRTASRGANFEDINLGRYNVAQKVKRPKNGLKTTNKGYSFLRGGEQWGNSEKRRKNVENTGAIKREKNGKETEIKRRKNDNKTANINEKTTIEQGKNREKTPRINSTLTARDQEGTAYPSPLCLNGKKGSPGASTLHAYLFNFGTYTGSSLQLPSPPGYVRKIAKNCKVKLSKLYKIVSNKQSSKTSKGKVISLAWSLGPCYTINQVNTII